MFQQQQRRTIRAAVSKSSGSSGGGGASSSFNIVHGLVFVVVLLMALVGWGMYVTVLSSFRTRTSSTSTSNAQSHKQEDPIQPAAQAHVKHEEKIASETADTPLDSAATKKEVLALNTKLGKIRIVLRPDLSPGSVDYMHRLIEAAGSDGSCPACRLYRAEKPGILQGILNKNIAANAVKGSCPTGSEDVPNDCPQWDKDCGCHGPVMTKGMVGWAAGTAGGQDFFINNYPNPARWWGTQHTVWGEIQDAQSFALIDQVWALPAKKQGGLTFLEEPLHFTVAME